MTAESLYQADVFLVGVGQFGLNQLTCEARRVIEHAKRVLHLTPFHSELCRLNSACEDLSVRYWQSASAWDVYQKLAKRVVEAAIDSSPTVLAVHGNPLFFNDICWETIRLGKASGLVVQALPGVSCIDVLPMQLGFDLGDLGAQIFEATQLVMFGLPMNPYLSTLILQVAEFGIRGIEVPQMTERRIAPLITHLLKFYPPSHYIIFARSKSEVDDQDLGLSTKIEHCGEILHRIVPGMTLYVPRTSIPEIVQELDLTV